MNYGEGYDDGYEVASQEAKGARRILDEYLRKIAMGYTIGESLQEILEQVRRELR